MNFKQTMRLVLPAALLLLSAPSQAGSFEVMTSSRCAQMPRKMLFSLINEIGIEKGLNLRAGKRISAQLICSPAGENYIYTYRITLEEARKDGNAEWVKVLDVKTDYGVLSEDLMIAQIKSATQMLVP
jgi:hypothetical protein